MVDNVDQFLPSVLGSVVAWGFMGVLYWQRRGRAADLEGINA